MFDYDKTLKKLKKLDELSAKKAFKAVDRILLSDDFFDWFHGAGNTQAQPITGPMISSIIGIMIHPNNIRLLRKRLRSLNLSDNFNRSSANLINIITNQAVILVNSESADVNVRYKANEIDTKTMKNYKDTADAYSSYIDALNSTLQEYLLTKYEIKSMSKRARCSKGLIFSSLILTPEDKYLKSYHIGNYTNDVLENIYTYTSNYKHDADIAKGIVWSEFFSIIMGRTSLPSVAVAILLEGPRKIEPYRDNDEFEHCKEIWDTLTLFALDTLEKCPSHQRDQMIDLYLKRVGNIFRMNRGTTQLRINMTQLPSAYPELIAAITKRSDVITRLYSDTDKGAPKQINQAPVNKSEPQKVNKQYQSIEHAPTFKPKPIPVDKPSPPPIKTKSYVEEDEETISSYLEPVEELNAVDEAIESAKHQNQ